MTVRHRGRHVFDAIRAAQYEGAIGQVADEIYWVDPTNGSDSNSGKNPDVALATTAQAITLANAYATLKGKTKVDTVIYHMPGTQTITASIACNLHGLKLVGLPTLLGLGQAEDCLIYWAAATAAGIEVTKPCVMEGLEISAVWVGTQVFDAEGCSIRLNGNAGGFAGNFCTIRRCSFPAWGEYGGIALVAGSYNLIEECYFATGLTAGIVSLGNVRNPVNNQIVGNLFDGPTYGLQMVNLGTMQNYNILGNYFGGNMTNALKGYAYMGGRSLFAGNMVGLTKANAMDGNLAAVTGKGIYAAGNHYTDGVDPRS